MQSSAYSTEVKERLEVALNANDEIGKKQKFEGVGFAEGAKLATSKPAIRQEIVSNKDKIMTMSWGPSPGDVRMAICGQDGACFVWDTKKRTRMYGCIDGFAQCVALSPDQSKPQLLVGGMRNATALYNKVEGTSVMKASKTWVLHDGYISSLHFIGPTKYISSGGDAEIRVFDIGRSEKDCEQVFRGHEKDCQSIKFPKDDEFQNTFITCSSDKTVKMWDRRTTKCTMSFTSEAELNACTIFPDGKLIACGGEKDRTYVFDTRAYKMVGKYARNKQKTASCEFSASGRQLFVGHDDGALIVWDIFGSGENKQYAHKVDAHTTYTDPQNKNIDVSRSRVQALTVGSQGFLASGGFDGKVRIWGAPRDNM